MGNIRCGSDFPIWSVFVSDEIRLNIRTYPLRQIHLNSAWCSRNRTDSSRQPTVQVLSRAPHPRNIDSDSKRNTIQTQWNAVAVVKF